MSSLFKKSMELNLKIEKFLDTISNSLALFNRAITKYLDNEIDDFLEIMNRICYLETEADNLEAEIKTTLYKFMLLPDTRADVLSLIKSLDDIIDSTEEITKDFEIQTPFIPEELHSMIIEMTEYSTKSAEELLLATRAFFKEAHLISSHVNKINFYEHETDLLQDKIERIIFKESILNSLSEKLHLKNFIGKIASISDKAETIGDKLTIFTIKREI